MSPEAPPLLVLWESVADDLFDRTARFPKSVRFTFCTRIDSLTLDILEDLAMARFTAGTSKERYLVRADSSLLRLRLLLRLCHRRRILDNGGYEHVMRALDEAGRMLGGWRQEVGRRGAGQMSGEDGAGRPPTGRVSR